MKQDEHFRPKGIEADITLGMIKTETQEGIGSEDDGQIFLLGYVKGNNGLDREHLLGNQLGGAGNVPENLVTLDHHNNAGDMEAFENMVAEVAKGGQTVHYKATPTYTGDNPIPDGIKLEARSQDGSFHETATIPNDAATRNP